MSLNYNSNTKKLDNWDDLEKNLKAVLCMTGENYEGTVISGRGHASLLDIKFLRPLDENTVGNYLDLKNFSVVRGIPNQLTVDIEITNVIPLTEDGSSGFTGVSVIFDFNRDLSDTRIIFRYHVDQDNILLIYNHPDDIGSDKVIVKFNNQILDNHNQLGKLDILTQSDERTSVTLGFKPNSDYKNRRLLTVGALNEILNSAKVIEYLRGVKGSQGVQGPQGTQGIQGAAGSEPDESSLQTAFSSMQYYSNPDEQYNWDIVDNAIRRESILNCFKALLGCDLSNNPDYASDPTEELIIGSYMPNGMKIEMKVYDVTGKLFEGS